MNIIKLPVELNPIVKSYQYTAFPMSIIESKGKDSAVPWLCSKFINCCFDREPRANRFLICLNDSYGKTDNILKHQHICMNKSTYDEIGLEYVDFLKILISDQNYIMGYCNEKYISSKSAYEKYDYMHDYLIYGYNDDKNVFYCLGYTNSMYYEEYEVSYDDFINSILYTNTDYTEFNAWKNNIENDYKINLDRIVKDLEEYSESVYNGDGWKNDFIFGMDAMKALECYFEETGDIDIRYTRAYMEHKYLMWKRFEYITNLNICNLSKWVCEYKLIYEKTKLIHNIGIKYNFTNNRLSLNSIFRFMGEINEYENNNLNNIISELKLLNDKMPEK